MIGGTHVKKTILSLILTALLTFSAVSGVYAANEGGTREFTIPVTLTVAHASKHINVTLPAAMPVSVLDGKLLTADNLQIQNHSDSLSIRVTEIRVTDGQYSVSSYDNFQSGESNRIALWINGCATAGPGAITLSETAFPVIAPGNALPIRYHAKVAAAGDVNGANAANIVFTLKAE